VGRPDGVSCRMCRTAWRLFRVDVSGGPRTTHHNRLLSSKNLVIKRDSVERIWLLMRVSALTDPAALYTGLEMIGPNGGSSKGGSNMYIYIAGYRKTPVLVFWTLRKLHWEFLRLWTGFELPSSCPALPCYAPTTNRSGSVFMFL
jgi:hypothetical protein